MNKISQLYTADWHSLANELDWQAEWRREKSTDFPHDAKRNDEAARRLKHIAGELRARSFPPALFREFESAARSKKCWSLWEEWGQQQLHILPASTAEEFLECCLKHWRRMSAE